MDAEQKGLSAEKPKILAQVRHSRILESLCRHGAISVGDIAASLSVSEMTIRRDLIELEKDGKLVRTHGGAVSAGKATDVIASAEFDRDEPTFDSRLNQNATSKRRIAIAAAAIAEGARTLALDVGTTTYLLSGLLLERQHTKIFTNSVRNAMLLGQGLGEVYLPGGRMRGDEMAISSTSAVSQFEELWFDIAFVGVSGITAQGIYDYSFEDSDMKRVFLRRATRKIVLCDSTKFNRMSLVPIGTLDQFEILLTDQMPPTNLAEALHAAGVEIRIAPEIEPSH